MSSNLGTNSFKYRIAGAPLVWSAAGLASALNRFVQSKGLEYFEAKHIQILFGCLEQEIDDSQLDTWLQIYKDLQKYIFISLTDRNICTIAADIVKRLLGNKKLCA